PNTGTNSRVRVTSNPSVSTAAGSAPTSTPTHQRSSRSTSPSTSPTAPPHTHQSGRYAEPRPSPVNAASTSIQIMSAAHWTARPAMAGISPRRRIQNASGTWPASAPASATTAKARMPGTGWANHDIGRRSTYAMTTAMSRAARTAAAMEATTHPNAAAISRTCTRPRTTQMMSTTNANSSAAAASQVAAYAP